MPVHKLQRTATVFKKKNTYTLYVTREKPYRPVRYIMHGYDTLLHSFYDHYIVDYLSFREWEFDFDVMKIPKGTKEVKLLRIIVLIRRGQNATFCWWNICNCMTWLFISSYRMPKVHVLITKHHVKMSGKVILFAKAPPIQTPFLAIISLSISSICQCRVISLISQSRLDQYHAKERSLPYRGAPLGESWW